MSTGGEHDELGDREECAEREELPVLGERDRRNLEELGDEPEHVAIPPRDERDDCRDCEEDVRRGGAAADLLGPPGAPVSGAGGAPSVVVIEAGFVDAGPRDGVDHTAEGKRHQDLERHHEVNHRVRDLLEPEQEQAAPDDVDRACHWIASTASTHQHAADMG